MRILISSFGIFATMMSLVSCSPNSDRRSRNDRSARPSKLHSEGGVDVGNMNSAAVPKTHASLFYPSGWSSATSADVLSLENGKGSIIRAKRSEIANLSSPNSISLQQHLKAKHPDRDYRIFKINGLEGVRADTTNTEARRRSDIYLVSELKDFIHIETDLNRKSNGIDAGEDILLTVRLEYKGVAYPNPVSKTVTLPYYDFDSPEYRKAAYSMLGDCYAYVDNDCEGVSFLFGNGGKPRLDVGNAGSDRGRIIELGPDAQVAFDAIKIDGKYLVAPRSRVPIADIYTTFTPKDPQQEQDSIDLKEGHVYLIRTINWPEEDLISKIRIDRLETGKSVTLTYTKLIYVEPKQLEEQVKSINNYTLNYEQPLTKGEVTLYNRSAWNSYYYASFNFEYSTSGNLFITGNGWDLLFGNNPNGPTFTVPHSSSSLGQVIDIGARDIDDISLSDYPDPNTFTRNTDPEVKVGHTYLVYHYEYDGRVIYGAVKVLELGPQGKWVRLNFRRVAIQPADHFQRWVKLEVPQEIQFVTLEEEQDYQKSIFYPLINKRGDQGQDIQGQDYDDINFSPKSGDRYVLKLDSRPYGNQRGFYKLGKNIGVESVTQQQIESLRGRLDHRIEIETGDVIAVLLENYYSKTVMVIKAEDQTPGKSVTLSMRYLYRAKTIYFDDT